MLPVQNAGLPLSRRADSLQSFYKSGIIYLLLELVLITGFFDIGIDGKCTMDADWTALL